MKKEEIKVKIESIEQSKKIEQILLALGEPLAHNYSMEKESYNFLIYSPEKIKGDEFGWLCFKDDVNLKEISFGQLIDLLNEPQKIAVKVENEKEFKALMKYYDSLGWKWAEGSKPSNSLFIPNNYPDFVRFEDEFTHTRSVGYNEKTGYQIIPFVDFAKEHNIKLPLLISVDGVELFEGDYYWCTNNLQGGWELTNAFGNDIYQIDSESVVLDCERFFSTKQAALKWIEEQKPKQIEYLSNFGIKCQSSKDEVLLNCGCGCFSLTVKDIEAIHKAMQELS